MKKSSRSFCVQISVLFFVLVILPKLSIAQSNLNVLQCNSSEEAIALVDSVLLANVNPIFKKNISVTGNPGSVGYFSNSFILGFEQTTGIVLSTGFTGFIDNPNTCINTTSGNTGGGDDPDLVAISGQTINDAIIIEFDLMLFDDSVHLDYVFGSEEYHEFVNTQWNDVFGFFVSGPGINGPYMNNAINIASVPGTNLPVLINNVNCGTRLSGCEPPPGSGPNCELLHNNTDPAASSFDQCMLDAFTVPFETSQEIESYSWYHFKLAIGDAGDPYYDSGVFLAKGSVNSIPVPQINVVEMQTNEEVINYLDTVFLSKVFAESKANISFYGDPRAFGYFSETDFLQMLVSNGLVFSTGFSGETIQLNECSTNANISSNNDGLTSDIDLEILSGGVELKNVGVFEFDFKPSEDSILFNYVFASEEYHTMIDAGYNDVFGIFLSGPGIEGEFTNDAENIATIPGDILPVNASTINFGTGEMTCGGKPEGCFHCEYLVDNSQMTDTAFFAFAFDGYTVPMNASYPVVVGEWYHVKVAIADAQTSSFDSGIFIANGTLISDSLTTSIENSSVSELIKIKPNPANDYLEIQNSGKESIQQFAIFNSSGQLLKKGVLKGNRISLVGLPDGLMVLELSTEKQTYRRKFIHK